MRRYWVIILVLLLVSGVDTAMAGKSSSNQPAIVLAAFGTSHPEALQGILNVKTKVEKTYPGLVVKLAFTSDIVRDIWHRRAGDQVWRQDHPQIPADLYTVKGPLATLADCYEQGISHIIVQSLHIFAGEEYADLKSIIAALESIQTVKAKYKPFKTLALGRPALGEPGETHDYRLDIAVAAQALSNDVAAARQQGAALVYVGHGNPTFSTGVYAELEAAIRQKHPNSAVFIGVVEGFPSRETVLEGLVKTGAKKVLLVPLMLVAGDHALNDMCGDDSDSWRSVLTKAGIEVSCLRRGLGEIPTWADIYIRHLGETMADQGVTLEKK